jgi:hypothetical protein
MYGVLEFLIGSLIPKPMPWLLVQLGVLAVWLIGGALAVKKWKTRGLWVLAAPPLFLLLYVGLFVAVAWAGCVLWSECP